MPVNEIRDLEEAETDLGEPSFPELRRNTTFIEVMVIVLLLIVSFHYKSCEDTKLIRVTFYNIVLSNYISTYLQRWNWK